MFEFGQTWAFWLVPLPIFIALFLPPVRQKRSALAAPFFKQLVEVTGQQAGTGVRIARRRAIQLSAMILVWILVVLALASPQIVGEPEKKVKTARSFLLAVDISSSMLTRDWVSSGERKSRWDALRDVMNDFISRREGDRIGLVVFGSQAFLQAPFTADLETVRTLMYETEVGMAGQQTTIGNAIGLAVELFEADSVESCVMMLLTDGVDSGSDVAPVQAAALAARDSIRIYTIGMGDPSSGQGVDETELREIARLTGGSYFLAQNPDELERVYAEMDELEPIEYEDESYRPTTLLFYYPLAIAIFLAILFHFIKAMRSVIYKKS